MQSRGVRHVDACKCNGRRNAALNARGQRCVDTGKISDPQTIDMVAAPGETDVADLEEYADGFVDAVAAVDGDLALAAREGNLVDELLTRTELRELLIGYVGAEDDSDVDYSAIGMGEYLAHVDLLNGETVAEENVGIIIASGTIQGGVQPPGAIGAVSQPIVAADGDPCDRFGVRIQEIHTLIIHALCATIDRAFSTGNVPAT
jgi:hypothetical protein